MTFAPQDNAVLGKYCADVETVREIMTDPALSAEEQIERKVDWLVREMDELLAFANNPETRDLIEREAIGIGQIRFRAQLILAFLEADKPSALRIVR
jgi:hypothetical protein